MLIIGCLYYLQSHLAEKRQILCGVLFSCAAVILIEGYIAIKFYFPASNLTYKSKITYESYINTDYVYLCGFRMCVYIITLLGLFTYRELLAGGVGGELGGVLALGGSYA